MSALELEEKIEEHLVVRLGDLAIRTRSAAVIFHNKVRMTKISTTPISRFAFLGEIKSVEYRELDGDEEVEIIVRAKKKAAP